MKEYTRTGLLGLLLVAVLLPYTAFAAAEETGTVRFTSVPDIFNWNISNPQPGWEDTLDWFFKKLKADGPDFTLNAGDIMDARWWDDGDQVRKKTEEYWGGFLKRFKAHDITVYVAPGDHEYGDDGGLARGDIARVFGEQFTKIMGMPRNGPTGHLGRSFFVREGGLLVITLDTFEDAGKRFAYTVGDEQLEWMDKVLTDHKDADFVIVQGHLPIVGPVKSKNSSASMLKGGTGSGLWKLMVRHKVDAYFCGEHHRITVHHHDGIWQIVHGALWGTQADLNYLRGVVTPGSKATPGSQGSPATASTPATLTLELLEFDVQYSGGYIGDHPHRGAKNKPRENVTLTEKTRADGPRVTGTLVLKARPGGHAAVSEASGWFEKPSEAKTK